MALFCPVPPRIRDIVERPMSFKSNNNYDRIPRQRRWLAGGAIAMALFAAGVGNVSAQMSIPGKFQVNAAGAATYTIPIAVPPGIAGMTPSLTLEYNSQAPNGILGMGWSLGGLPTITRCATTIAQDGVRTPVTYTSADRFCLEGQRLVAISGTYGHDQTEYRTEVDGFSRIISRGTAGSGPAWFEVHTKSGQIMQLGYSNNNNSNNSQILVPASATVRAWLVNQVSDTAGNSFTVQYEPDTNGSGQAYPQLISYAGNTINFVYSSGRPDKILLYEAGSPQEVTMLLTNVQTSSPTGPVADYRLAYQPTSATHRSFLTSVTLCDRASTPTCLPATNIGWNSSGDGFTLGAGVLSTTGGRAPAAFAQGDVNGDGCGDLIMYWTDTNSANFFAKVLLSDCQGHYTVPGTWQTQLSNVSGYNSVTLADVDGDGRADLVISFIDTNGFRAKVALSNGQTFNSILQTWGSGTLDHWNLGVDNVTYGYPYPLWSFSVADIDGDGRADLIAYVVGYDGAQYYLSTYVALATPGGGNFAPATYNGIPGDWAGATLMLADINGDGCTDLVANIVNVTNWKIFAATSQGNGTFAMANPGGTSAGGGFLDWFIVAGDLNGDGRTDLVAYHGDTQKLQIVPAFSRGDGTFTFPWTTGGQATLIANGQSYQGYSLTLADVNGDGRADLIPFLFNTDQSTFFTLISNGDGSFTTSGGYRGAQTGGTLLTPDINGDGRSDVAFIGFDPNPNPPTLDVISFITPGQALAATSFTTGLGATTTVYYRPLTSDVYAKGSGAGYPQQDIQGPFYVVKRVDAPTSLSNPYTTYYAYAGARLDLSGRGFLGFQQMDTWDQQTTILTATSFSQNFPFIGLVTSEQKSLGSQLLNDTQNTYQFVNSGGAASVSQQSITAAPYRVALLSSQASSYDLDGSSIPTLTTTYGALSGQNPGYDAFNNPLSITVSASDGYSKTTINTYSNDTTNWFLGRLTLAQVTATAPTPPALPGQPTPPDMTIAVGNGGGPFMQGQTGATYTITVTNSGGGPSSGEAVTVEDSLPTGLTATAMSGAGWTCEVGIGSPNCTRSDVLAAGAPYPPITLTVNVASNALSPVINAVTVSGGGEVNTSNDTASIQTTVSPSSAGTKVYLTSGTSWTVPSNWNSSHNTVEVIGGGGGGSPAVLNSTPGAGGGGGAYSKVANLALTPGGAVTYQVGSGGAASSTGGDTWFNGATLTAAPVGAKGGGGASGTTAGSGGAAANGVGSTTSSGGSGGAGNGGGMGGGGGGGAGGPNGNGGNGANDPNGTLGGGGGGSSGGGGAGAAPSGGYGGTGGNNASGSGAGPGGDPTNPDNLDGSAGVQGGGGGGGAGVNSMDDGWGGYGGNGSEWSASYGSGGGAGGGGGSNGSLYAGGGGNGGKYGGGGSGGGTTNGSSDSAGPGGSGAQGLIVITYWP